MMRIFPDLESLSLAAAELIVVHAEDAIRAKGLFILVLSGGQTPRRTYELIAADRFRKRIEWSKVHIFWGDERCVGSADPRRNERMIREALLDRVPIPAINVHAVSNKTTSRQTALTYESDVKSFFGGKPPVFDIVLLGLGQDGHTASLFPGTDALKEDKRWVVETHLEKEDFERVTMTAQLVNRAALIVFLVSGREKADILHKVTAEEATSDTTPVQIIHPFDGNIIWLVDKAASGLLTQ